MYKVLFVCTANIFRSRFSEEVFNFLAKKNNIKAMAFSAGLKVGAYISRTIYPPALEYLNIYGIEPQRKDELSTHINKLNLNDYQKIICLDEVIEFHTSSPLPSLCSIVSTKSPLSVKIRIVQTGGIFKNISLSGALTPY